MANEETVTEPPPRMSHPVERTGLSAAEARSRLSEGYNELPSVRSRTLWRIIADVMREPMLALLMVGGLAYLLLGNLAEALILIGFAGFSIIVTIVQESRTEHVLEALRDLSAPRALVIRDGNPVRIPGREVVRGDLLLLEPGDRVAADALLIEASDVHADESLLTGESVPVSKRAALPGDPAEGGDPGGDDRPYLYSATLVTRGHGMAQVIATGPASQLGKIGQSLAALDVEAPRLRRETGRIVRLFAIGGGLVAALVVLLYGLLRGGWLEAVLAGIAISMSLLPEEFPVVLTIFLAMGAWRIAQVGVLTRRAAAIETMGATTVLCTDKTGTLTQNRMTVTELWSPATGEAPVDGPATDPALRKLVEASALASAPVPVDPMEVAFHDARRDLSPDNGQDGWGLVHSYGLRPDLLAMSNVWQRGDGDGELMVAAKGAPEAIAELCHLPPPEREALDSAARSMADRGIRVLGIATACTHAAALPEQHEAHDFTLLGLVGLSDPLRAGVPEAVGQCRSAGIRVVMITGDYAATARAIADQAGIADGELMTGSQVAAISDDALAERIRDVTVFARTMPEQKLRIVSALKAAGEVVAMTGDGVNDAPALKAAHIGVAMGKRGTDVAREAASIVLVDDDFGAIVNAIRLGRRIYDNIRKAMGFIFGVHVPIAGLALLPLVTGLPVLFGPIQIALLEMIIDPVCALVFEAEREERRIMARPPRDPAERLFSWDMVARSLTQGTLALLLLSVMFVTGDRMGMTAAQLRTLVFFALVVAILALVLANRSFSSSILQALGRHNRSFRYVLLVIAGVSGAILTLPPLQRLLQFAPLSTAQLLLIPIAGTLLLIVLEWTKRRPGPEAGPVRA